LLLRKIKQKFLKIQKFGALMLSPSLTHGFNFWEPGVRLGFRHAPEAK
jgi:hypothetical protein